MRPPLTPIRAHLGLAALTDGSARGVADVAASLEMEDASDLSRAPPLAFLSPKMTEVILSGRQRQDLTLRKLTRDVELPIDWTHPNEMLASCAETLPKTILRIKVPADGRYEFVRMLVDVKNNGSLNRTDRDRLSNFAETPRNFRISASRYRTKGR